MGSKREVIGIGAGGHAKVVIDILRLRGEVKIKGLLDANRELWRTTVLDVPILGDDSLLPSMLKEGIRHAFIGVGTVGGGSVRKRLYREACELGFQPVAAIHPQAVVADSVSFGNGPTIMAGVIINAGAQIGENVIVNTGAIVEHDCNIGSHAHIATGARLCSTVRVDNGAHIGAGATVKQCITIGEGSIVGAGAVVVKDVEPWTVVVGVPARPMPNRQPVPQKAEPVVGGD